MMGLGSIPYENHLALALAVDYTTTQWVDSCFSPRPQPDRRDGLGAGNRIHRSVKQPFEIFGALPRPSPKKED
jgi:hypothetical protein